MRRTDIGCVAVLLGMMGCVTDVAALGESDTSLAGKRGLSPIIVAVLLGMMGCVTDVAALGGSDTSLAGKRGLSPIIAIVAIVPHTMDVPYAPAQQTPIVLAQAATPGATPQPDYILKACKETETTGDPRSAMRAVDPAFMLKNYLEWHDQNGLVVELNTIKITLLEDTKHGELTSVVDNTGRPWYRYDPEPDYVGKDRAVFMAEFEGKRYKIVLELRVFRVVDENNPTCPEPKLIKVKKPSTGSSGYDMVSITVTFADLPNGAVGQAVGNTITLDTNAAGYNQIGKSGTDHDYCGTEWHCVPKEQSVKGLRHATNDPA